MEQKNFILFFVNKITFQLDFQTNQNKFENQYV